MTGWLLLFLPLLNFSRFHEGKISQKPRGERGDIFFFLHARRKRVRDHAVGNNKVTLYTTDPVHYFKTFVPRKIEQRKWLDGIQRTAGKRHGRKSYARGVKSSVFLASQRDAFTVAFQRKD